MCEPIENVKDSLNINKMSKALKSVIKSVNPKVVRYVRKTMQVTTLSNGGKKFIVEFDNKKPIVSVYFAFLPEHQRTFVVFEPDEVWIGCGSYGDVNDMAKYTIGNAVLIRKGRFCWLIGTGIHTFVLNDEERIIKYVSTVQNSGVPYGYIETDTRYIGIKNNNCEKSLTVDKSSSETYDMEQLQCMSAYEIPTTPFYSVQLL